MPDYNLLFIFTDQQRQDTLRVYGREEMRTPNLDGLAGESMVFNRAYVTQPVCTPSRSSIMTGLYPHTSGCTENNIPLDREYETIAEMLPENSYESGYFGKWHLGDEVMGQHGFEKNWVSIDDMYHKYYTDEILRHRYSSYYHFLCSYGLEPDREEEDGFKYFSRPKCARLPRELSKPAFVSRNARQFIRENRDRKFCCYVNFFEPHSPFFGPFDKMYDPQEVQFGPAFMEAEDESRPLRRRLRSLSQKPHSEEMYRKRMARYLGLVSLVDHYTGKILDTLRECGLEENTIVVFTSDHGDMMGEHRLQAKTYMYDESAKVPLLMKVPHLEHGQRFIDTPVSQVDLVPTLLDLLGENIPDAIDGNSLLPFLRGDASEPPCRDVVIEWQGPNGHNHTEDAELSAAEQERIAALPARAIVTPEGWKFVLRKEDKSELYNLREDPHERHNLYGRAEYEELIAELTERIYSWQERTGDSVSL